MSSTKGPSSPAKPRSGFSRRGFIGRVGVGGGALGLLEKGAAAAPPGGVVGPGPVAVTLTVNGKPLNLTIEPRVTLLDAMRNYAGLTGAKRVCDRGTCGACTMIVGGKPVYSCTVLAIDAQGKNIETIEGLAPGNEMHPVSAAFVNNDAQQCGYCTSGFVMACKGFLDEHPNPTMEQVKRGLGGNLCRCGTYMGVRKAVLEVAAATRAKKGGKNG